MPHGEWCVDAPILPLLALLPHGFLCAYFCCRFPHAGCDWLQFKFPDGRDVTGQLSGTSFPGQNGADPLVIDADTVVMTWHTDG